MDAVLSKYLSIFLFFLLLVPSARTSASNDWPEWRGPARDGISLEKGLPTHWSPKGENLAWKAPFGGRSAPIAMGDRVFLQNASGKGETLQERVMCFNADTGKVLWEHHFNVYLSDVPPHRVGWASPVGDPVTGNVYALGVGGTLVALSKDGKPIWERSLGEDFGLWTTHGGRTVSPVIDGDLVIISGITENWGDQAERRFRFMAFNKLTGQTVWVSTPGGRPFDTTYSPPVIVNMNGTRLLIAGGGDCAVSAVKVSTGEPVWTYLISKRGINTGVAVKGTTVFVSHSEENLDTNEMGLLAAVDGTARGPITKDQIKWVIKGVQCGFSSPVIDGDRLYQIDNGANVLAFDVNTGKELWKKNLGTIQKSSPVLADGKLYVGTENGKFFILKPGPDGCEVLSENILGSEAAPEQIIASVAISHGRVFLVSDSNLYCIGKKSGAAAPAPHEQPEASNSNAPVAYAQVIPTEVILKPGESVQFHVRTFDAQGRFLSEGQANWSLDALRGDVQGGKFTAASDSVAQAGLVKATVGQVTGAARVRIIPPLPWSENFDSLAPGNSAPAHWINARGVGRYEVREVEGNKLLVKKSDNQTFKRIRTFFGPSDMANYTIEADVRATEKRRQMGDAGVVAQRYALVLYGNNQRLQLEPWQPETARTVAVPFAWKPDTWYRLKLQVENLPDGKVRIRGKAWAVGEAEPAAWLIEKTDPIPNRQGSPGIYADAPFEVFFDNLKVTSNK